MRPLMTLAQQAQLRNGGHSVGGVTLVGGATLVGAALGGSGGQINQSQPKNGRRQNLGFPTTTVTTLATSNLVSAPQTYFRPDRLFIASSVGANFTVAAVLVGNKEQFVNANPCPSAMFSELAVNADVEYDTCEPAVSITVGCTNTDTVSHAITPGMTGRSAY
jgi:hypothetical protein